MVGYGERLIGGSVITYNPDPSVLGRRSKCDDVVDGTRKPHGLTITHDECYCEPLNGTVIASATSWRKYHDKRPGWASSLGASGATLPSRPSNNAIATQVMERSNPSRAEVDMGVAIAELREAPQLIHRAGQNLLEHGANYFLTYQFGWSPLVNDALDCLDVVQAYNRRLSELQSLYRKGGLRRRIDLPTQVGQQTTTNTTLESVQGDLIQGTLVRNAHRRIWGVARWRPTLDGLPTDSGDMERLMRRTLYGLHVDASTVWNLVPWSWLIDWFGTFGDYLEANRNTVGAVVNGPISVMWNEVKFDQYLRGNSHPSVSGGGGFKRTETKNRSLVPFILPEARFPLLGATRLSILSSLAVLRIPRELLGNLRRW